MLAATSDPASQLGLLSVVLRSVYEPASGELSTSLKERAYQILHAAAEIAANPATIAAGTAPEAIELAFKLRSSPDLTRELRQLQAFDALQPAIAENILKSLHPIAA